MDFEALLQKKITPPIIPEFKNKADTQNFEAEFLSETPQITPADGSELAKCIHDDFQHFAYTFKFY